MSNSLGTSLQYAAFGQIAIDSGGVHIWSGDGTNWAKRVTVGPTGNFTTTGVVFIGVYTFATLPLASANTGAWCRVSDRSQKPVYSDGTNWKYFSDDSTVT
jgi:hypothetical protein